MQDIQLPEVQAMGQRARFFKEDGKDLVEISFVGGKDTVKRKVKPEDMARFKTEWDAFCDGSPLKMRIGTALTEIMDENRANGYIAQNIHNCEELAILSDGQCQSCGHGTLTLRETARNLVAQRQFQEKDRLTRIISEQKAAPAPEANAEVDALKAEVAEMKAGQDKIMGMLTELLAKRGPGRPKNPPKDN